MTSEATGETESKQIPAILVVDDREDQRKLYTILADKLGIAAHPVASGADALRAAESGTYRAIIMDLSMPGMDGFECAKQLRDLEKASGKRTPIIAVTADVTRGIREKCYEADMDDYLSKPFRLSDLKAKLQTWLQLP